jgi:transcriptional regulator with XRE-family HTH domain
MVMTDARSTKRNLAAHLGATPRETRKDAELTQADIAERIGVVTFARCSGWMPDSSP